MRGLLAAGLSMMMAVCFAADNPLQIAVSRRVPCSGDVIRLAACPTDAAAAPVSGDVIFSVEQEGRERPVGKTRVAPDPNRPFEPSVEWRAGLPGLYRVIVRQTETGPPVARLLLPVVAQPVFFGFYGPTRPEVEWMTHHLSASATEIEALHARGVVALKKVGGVSYLGGTRWEQIPPGLDMAALAPRILKDYTDTRPWDGIAIDELGMWEQHPEQTALALEFGKILKQARLDRPDQFTAIWQFGSLTPLECNLFRDSADVILCEVYENYFRAWNDLHSFEDYLSQRIQVARSMQVIKKTIIGLSIASDFGDVTPEELEEQVRRVRMLGPEMRGLAFYTTGRCSDAVLKRANECCFRYFVRPVVGFFSEGDLTLSDYQPVDQGTVRVQATVHNLGGMDARQVRVRFWDGDPAKGGEPIGGPQFITRLPAARWVDPDGLNTRSKEPAETLRREGFGIVTVSVPWKAKRGPHQLWAEIVPDAQYTTLRGFQELRVTVR